MSFYQSVNSRPLVVGGDEQDAGNEDAGDEQKQSATLQTNSSHGLHRQKLDAHYYSALDLAH